METADEDPVPPSFNDKYYFNLLVDLENITAPKVPTTFALPDDSIWNTLDLAALAKKTAISTKKVKISNFERDVQRINASAAAAVPTKAKRSHAAHIAATSAPLNNRERLIEQKLFEQYRQDPAKYRILLDRVQETQDAKKQTLKHRADELSIKMQAQNDGPALTVDERLQEAVKRRATILQDQQQALEEVQEERRARHSTIFIPTHMETAALKAARATDWLKLVAAMSRVAMLISVLREARKTKAQNIAAWNAALCIQRFWRAHFFQRLAREAALAAQSSNSSPSGKFMSSVGSARLRRATRSEKHTGGGPGNSGSSNPAADELQLQLVQRLEQARKVDAACVIGSFLLDIEKMFKNRIFKFRRIVKFLQIKVRTHLTVGHARAHTLAMWLERHLPALALHIKIVTAGRGLDLNNLTANDREHLRATQQQYKDYRYKEPHHAHGHVSTGISSNAGETQLLDQQQPRPTEDNTAAEEERKRKINRILSKFDLSLLKQMNSIGFHEFLRNHLEQIQSSDFHLHHLTNAAPAAVVASTAAGGGASGAHGTSIQYLHGVNGTAHAKVHAHHAHHGTVVKYDAIMELIVRKRREYSKRINQKAEVVYEKLKLTLDDARSFIKGERDPLSARLKEISLAEAVEEGVRRRQQLGTRRQPNSFAVMSLHRPEAASVHSALLAGGHRGSVTPGTPPRLGHGSRQSSNRNMGGTSTPTEDGRGTLKRGPSWKAAAEPTSPIRPPPGSPGGPNSAIGEKRAGAAALLKSANGPGGPGGADNEGAAVKRGTSSKGNASLASAPAAAVIAPVPVVELPPPNVFLLLSNVTAQDMLLLYIEVADKVRRQTLVDKLRRRGMSTAPGAAFGHGHHVPQQHLHSGHEGPHHVSAHAPHDYGQGHGQGHGEAHHFNRGAASHTAAGFGSGDSDEPVAHTPATHLQRRPSAATAHRRPSKSTDFSPDVGFALSAHQKYQQHPPSQRAVPHGRRDSRAVDNRADRIEKIPHVPHSQKPSAESISTQKRGHAVQSSDV